MEGAAFSVTESWKLRQITSAASVGPRDQAWGPSGRRQNNNKVGIAGGGGAPRKLAATQIFPPLVSCYIRFTLRSLDTYTFLFRIIGE